MEPFVVTRRARLTTPTTVLVGYARPVAERPGLPVCAADASEKIGAVRTSRMIFGRRRGRRGGAVTAPSGGRPLHRIAIVNRGEPAMRLINAVREWNAEGRRATDHDRPVHRGRPARHVRPGGRRGRADRSGRGGRDVRRPQPVPGPGRAGQGAAGDPGRRGVAGLGVRLGEGGVRAALPASWASPSSAPPPRSCAISGTRSRPSCWPSGSACRWPRGAAVRCRTWPRPASTPSASATR